MVVEEATSITVEDGAAPESPPIELIDSRFESQHAANNASASMAKARERLKQGRVCAGRRLTMIDSAGNPGVTVPIVMTHLAFA